MLCLNHFLVWSADKCIYVVFRHQWSMTAPLSSRWNFDHSPLNYPCAVEILQFDRPACRSRWLTSNDYIRVFPCEYCHTQLRIRPTWVSLAVSDVHATNVSRPRTQALEGKSNLNEKSAQRETQTLRAGCSKAEPKISAPPQIPFPEAQDGQNLISWRGSLHSPTDPVWWKSMHAISSYRGNRPTNTNRQDQLENTAPLSLACSVMNLLL